MKKAEEQDQDSKCLLDEVGRRIYLFGAITEDKISQFMVFLGALDRTDGVITVILNSCGGSIEAGYAAYDATRLAQNQVIIEGYGQIYSMATLVLQGGDKRLLSPQCEVMVHDVFVEAAGELTIKTAATLAKDIVKSNKHYQGIIAAHTKLPLKRLAKMCKKETYMTAQEAIDLGFADGYIPTRKKVKNDNTNRKE